MAQPTPNKPVSPRTEAIARSFYDQLSREGFTPQQVVGLATNLLDLVRDDLHRLPAPAQAK